MRAFRGTGLARAPTSAKASTVRPTVRPTVRHDADWHDDDLFADGEERRRQRLAAFGAYRAATPSTGPDAPPTAQSVAARAAALTHTHKLQKRRHSKSRAGLWALLGFLVGIAFWHMIGFWGFVSQVVLPAARVAPSQSSVEGIAPAYAGPTPTSSPRGHPVSDPKNCRECGPGLFKSLLRLTAPHTRRRAKSLRISRAALWPGTPVTPPPGCAPEPQK